jgi:hypothetical protein
VVKRISVAVAVVLGAALVYVAGHGALIEVGREVIVLRTQEADGHWLETRLWIVDDGEHAWLHGDESRWVRNLKERPVVEVVRGGETRRYRAEAIGGEHRSLHALLREKYGLADRWVRLVGPDRETTVAVRLDPIDEKPGSP